MASKTKDTAPVAALLPQEERERRLAFALSLAQKAGALQSGEWAVQSALGSHKAVLLLVAADAAPNTKKDWYYYADRAGVPVYETMTTLRLGSAIGKGKRSAVAVLNRSFAGMVEKWVKIK